MDKKKHSKIRKKKKQKQHQGTRPLEGRTMFLDRHHLCEAWESVLRVSVVFEWHRRSNPRYLAD